VNTHRLRVAVVPVMVLLVALLPAGAAFGATGSGATAASGSHDLAAQLTPGLVVQPAIIAQTCGSGTTSWVHMRIANPTVPDQCLGFTGTWTNYGVLPNAGFCGGNNYGTWTGYDANDNWRSGSFGQGTTYTSFGVDHFNTITILGWYGSETCPY
jgi:hypothetical protein